MKKLVGLMLAVMMALTVMLPLTALAEEPVTISFFDKNSGVRTFDDPVAKALEERTGIKLALESPSGNPGEKLSLIKILPIEWTDEFNPIPVCGQIK